jgi:hypothetical protein
MSGDRAFTNPRVGRDIRIEQYGREVRLIFVAGTQEKANELVESIVAQLKEGALTITVMGKPTSIVELLTAHITDGL